MRVREQGSVVGYAVGGVLLLALLVGGIMVYKNTAGNLGGGALLGQNSQTNQDSSDNASTDTTESDQAAQNEAALKKQQEEAEQKAKEQNAAAQNSSTATSQETAPTTDTNQQLVAVEVPQTSTAPAEQLPATGPEDGLWTIAGLSTLAGLGVAYYRSRSSL